MADAVACFEEQLPEEESERRRSPRMRLPSDRRPTSPPCSLLGDGFGILYVGHRGREAQLQLSARYQQKQKSAVSLLMPTKVGNMRFASQSALNAILTRKRAIRYVANANVLDAMPLSCRVDGRRDDAGIFRAGSCNVSELPRERGRRPLLSRPTIGVTRWRRSLAYAPDVLTPVVTACTPQRKAGRNEVLFS